MDAVSEDAKLKLAVLDEEDLAVMSAHLQDAWAKPGDMAYLPQTRRFAATVCRVDWARLMTGKQERCAAGFHFECVTRVQRLGIAQDDPEAKLQLLSLSFTPTEAPGGEVRLIFSGGGIIKLDVECLEAEMRDLCASWPVHDCPRHVLDEASAAV